MIAIGDAVVVTYYTIYMTLSLWFLAVAWREVRRDLQHKGFDPAPDPGPFAPLVSLLVPAWNEEVTVVESVRSLLRLRYPRFEIILINDGSSDRTVEVLKEAFQFREAPVDVNPHLPTAQIRKQWAAPVPKGSACERFVLVDKSNGGKADALNAGINAARGSYCCSMDADSLMVPDALARVVQPLLDDPDGVVACGVQVAISNGSTVQEGEIVKVALPTNFVARIQIVEYMRSFTMQRTALGRLGMLLILSGVFAVFRRDLLIEIGGFLTPRLRTRAALEYCGEGAHTVCEDMEVIVRLHRYLRDRGRSGEVRMLPDPLAWTEAPESLQQLGKQRSRWYRGLLESLWLHRHILFRPRFGSVGSISMPFQWLYEAMSTPLELIGYVLLPLSWFLGLVSGRMAALFMVLALMCGLFLSVAGIVLSTWAEGGRGRREKGARLFSYPRPLDLVRLCIAAVAENFGYRQVLLWWRARGLWDYLRGRRAWDKLGRKGFAAAGAPR